MKTKTIQLFLSITLLCMAGVTNAQMRVGGSSAPNPSAVLDLNPDEGDNAIRGLALPRVKLVSTTNCAPLAAHVAGMFVYNTATVADVKPGVYYNNGTKWIASNSGSIDDVSEIKQLEITLNETIGTQSKTFFGTTATAGSTITIVGIEPQLTGDPMMLGALLKVNALANLNSSATAINWTIAIESDNINTARICTLEKVIISYICNEDLNGTQSGTYSIAGR